LVLVVGEGGVQRADGLQDGEGVADGSPEGVAWVQPGQDFDGIVVGLSLEDLLEGDAGVVGPADDDGEQDGYGLVRAAARGGPR
jgi:hypothetical protein